MALILHDPRQKQKFIFQSSDNKQSKAKIFIEAQISKRLKGSAKIRLLPSSTQKNNNREQTGELKITTNTT